MNQELKQMEWSTEPLVWETNKAVVLTNANRLNNFCIKLLAEKQLETNFLYL